MEPPESPIASPPAPPEVEASATAKQRMESKRDRLAEEMWKDYKAIQSDRGFADFLDTLAF